MTIFKSFLSIFFVFLLALATTKAKAQEEGSLPMNGDISNGTRLYRVHCTVCHGFHGSGDGPARATLKKAPADHRNGSLMNARDDQMLLSTVLNGCHTRGCSKAMPAFGDGLNSLDAWDLVAYLRSLHMPLVNFFPKVSQYLVKQYHIGHLGNDDFKDGQMERLKKYAGRVSPQDLTKTIFPLFKADSRRPNPELVPQEPRRLARLKKADKLGYVLFMEMIGPRKRKVPIGLAIDRNYAIVKLVTTLDDPGQAGEYNRRLEKYVGMGKRGDAPKFKTGRAKVNRIFDKAVIRVYALAVEAANAFELEERERSWADDTF